MNRNALLILAKNPVKGKVKTRLAATVGEEQALKIYLALLAHTRQVARQLDARRYIFYSDFVEEKDGWDARLFTKKIQHGADIGERMSHCFAEILPVHPMVVLIGCDLPGLSVDILELAFEKLAYYDFVIGPAEDGGYYLIGMKTFELTVFQGVEWSASTVFEKTIQNIVRLGKTWFQLPVLPDVDNEGDWERHGWAV